MATVKLLAPLTGWAAPLDEVPDQVFSQRMLGDGLAIDPTLGEVRAPFDGVVAVLPPSRHAISVRHASGLEVLIHVGLETVALKGRGFTAHVKEGDRVAAGALLLTFDMDSVGRGATSLMTPIVVTGEGWSLDDCITDVAVRAGDRVLTIGVAGEEAEIQARGSVVARTITSTLPHGLHARPAARVAAARAAHASRVTLRVGERVADAASPVSMMTLGLKPGDALTIEATGPDAEAAVEAIATLILSGMGEASEAVPAQPVAATGGSGPVAGADGELIFSGVRASSGLVVGQARRLFGEDATVEERGGGLASETEALDQALARVGARLEAERYAALPEARAIAAAHLAFLSDPEITGAAKSGIAEGRSAAYAWRAACRTLAERLRGMDDARLAERADDLLDIERQVLAALRGDVPAPAAFGSGDVLIADDILPSQLLSMGASRPAALCTARGGATSHVAILAQALGVPALAALGEGLERIADGALVVVDANAGRLVAYPSAQTLAAAESQSAAERRRRADAVEAAQAPCHTADGARIEVFANLGQVAEAAPAVQAGAEGCGLLRTEFLFLDRQTAPDEDEQHAQYQAIADALDGRTLIVRTLDAGGDKPLPYLPQAAEANPALGLRGVRGGLWRPELLATQLRAVCRVRSTAQVAVMLPMIASIDEVRQVRAMLARAASETGGKPPLLGVMIETPAAALTLDLFAPLVDFASVGTNDLTQYALAMDRENPVLAPQLDALHPAVLRLIAAATSGGSSLKWIGVCGALASDPLAAPILIGLGVAELSVAPSMIPEIKSVVRGLTLADCRTLASAALAADSAEAVRHLARQTLNAGAVA